MAKIKINWLEVLRALLAALMGGLGGSAGQML